MALTLTNCRALLADGSVRTTTLTLADGCIAAPGTTDAAPAGALDLGGALVLPGMVDLHGDAFERQLLPRPGVRFPAALALAETDRQLLANGITTAFYGITCSWEPGLRSRDSAAALIGEIATLRPSMGCDARIHLRWETFNLDAEDWVAGLLRQRCIDLLAFNDHIDDIRDDLDRGDADALAVYAHRTGLDAPALRRLFDAVAARAEAVPAAIERLARLAADCGVPCASHDDDTSAVRYRFDRLGVALCEFPVTLAVARASRALGNPIILGAPNVVRGGSHCDRLGASEAVAGGLCDILTSDYYYPSMLDAAFRLLRQRGEPLAEIWARVSSNPAAAAGLDDRGLIAPGRRADLLVIDDRALAPRVIATLVAGQVRHASAALLPCPLPLPEPISHVSV